MNTRIGMAMMVALVTTMLLLAATAPYSMPGTNGGGTGGMILLSLLAS